MAVTLACQARRRHPAGAPNLAGMDIGEYGIWCGGWGDHTAIEAGKDAEDAQMRLYQASKAAGHTACWPVWQGRVAG